MQDQHTTIEFAKKIRAHALNMTHKGKSAHVGAVLSMADIMAVLYGHFLNVKPKDPKWPQRDRFILSKGHAGAGVYASLAIRGFFSEDLLARHYQDGSVFSGHVSHKGIPGVEFSTGSLGHGLPVATGMAYAARLQEKSHRVVALVSDGELDEGSNWEAILFAAHHKLSRLIAIVDYNGIQSLDTVENTLGLEPLADKWKSFGWHVQEVDGHDHAKLIEALSTHHLSETKPNCLIAKTTKGKGVSFMENKVKWHYHPPGMDELKLGLEELENP